MMQLQRSGFPISSETVAKAMDLGNWGTLEGNTEYEKWCSEQRQKLEFAVGMKQLETSLIQQGPSAPPEPIGVGGSKAAPGRPPTGQLPPHMETKASASGPRAVISESG